MTNARQDVGLAISGDVATLTLDRPEARNALSFAMYDALAGHCETLASHPGLAAVIVRGAGGAFAAGTDIAEFVAVTDGAAGLRYEARVEAIVSAVESLPAPTIALVDGPAMGGGLVLAAACDFRIATPRATFGVPVARTLGNLLSARNTARLEREFGVARVRRLLLLSEAIGAEEARDCGFVLDLVAPERLEARGAEVAARLRRSARGTLAASREVLRRIGRGELADEDLVERTYGGPDFAEGVAAFRERRKPAWTVPTDDGGAT